MGKPSDSLLSAIKWFDFLSLFLMMSVGSGVCMALMTSPMMITSPPVLIGIVVFGIVIPLLFKIIETMLIQGGLHDSWGLFGFTLILGICFAGLLIFTLKSYISLDTIYMIKDNIPKITQCLAEASRETLFDKAQAAAATTAAATINAAATAANN